MLFLVSSVSFSSFSLFAANAAALDVGALAYKIQPRSPPLLSYLLAPQSCAGFSQELRLPLALSQTKDFAKTADYALQAKLAMENAASYARMQRLASVVPPYTALAVYAYSSLRCFEEASRSLYLAGEASREALRAAGANADALQRLTNSDYEGAAAGVLEELREVDADVQSGATEGKAFGKWINRAAEENDAAWRALGEGKASSASVFSAARMLAGENFFLSEAIAFNARAVSAKTSLEFEVSALEREADDFEWKARGELEALEGERLWLVGENAFQLVGSGAVLATQYSIASFEDDLNEVKRSVAEAQRKQKQCSSARSAKAQGWASDCVVLLRSASSLLDSASLACRGVDSRARLLETTLRERILEEQEKTRQAIDEVRETNPFAAAAAAAALEKNYDELAQALETRGERISFYLKEITTLRDLQEAARASPFSREEKTALLARVTAFKKMLADAEADEVSVEFEKREAAAVEAAAQRLDEGQKSVASLLVLKQRLQSLEDGVFALAFEKYGELLRGEREKIAGFYDALTEKQKALFDSYDGFFDAFGRLRVRVALGSLKNMRGDYESLLEYAELRLPELLKREFEESAVVFSRVEDARLGVASRVRTRVEFENRLPFGYGKQILVSIPSIAAALAAGDYDVVSKSDEVAASPNGLYVSKIVEGGKYYFEFEREERIASETRRSEETVYASRAKAVKRTTIRFRSERDALVVVPLSLSYAAALSSISSTSAPQGVSSSTQTRSALGSSFAAVLQARAGGENDVSFEYEIDSPITLAETRSFDEAKATQRFDLVFASKAPLDGVALDYSAQLGCEPKSVKLSSDSSGLKGEYAVLQDSVAVSFTASRMEANAPYSATVIAQCDSLAAAFAAKLAEVKQLAASAQLSLEMRLRAQDLIRAAQTLSETDSGKALAKLYDAEAFITTEQERGARDAAARAEYSLREAQVLELAAAADNASLALASRGYSKESGEAAKAAQDARSLAGAARSLAENGEAAQALNKLWLAEDALRTTLGNSVRSETAALAAQCAELSSKQGSDGSGACSEEIWGFLQQASALAAAGDFAGALEAAGEARVRLNLAAVEGENALSAKKALLSRFTASRDSFDAAAAAFNDAFAVPSDYAGERSRSLDWQEGSASRKDGEKRVAALGEAWSALETSDESAFSKFSLSFLNDSAARLANDELTLREKTSLARANARDALATAQARQKQFGDEKTRSALDTASGAFDAGNYFTAWVIADAVNRGLAGVGGGKPAGVAARAGGILDVGGDSSRWTLGVVGILVLAALVYALVLQQKRRHHRGL